MLCPTVFLLVIILSSLFNALFLLPSSRFSDISSPATQNDGTHQNGSCNILIDGDIAAVEVNPIRVRKVELHL
jgi:hypothetical protein